MQDIVLIGTLMTILTAIYMLPIASLHNVPKEYMNRLTTILVPEVIILVCLHFLLLQVYHFMEHHKTPGVYIAFAVISIQIALVYNSIFNHWGLSSQEVEESVINNPNTSLQPCFNNILLAGLIHLTSLFIALGTLTVIN
tara:strand:- start:43 stop:462 length:420 start_codon:yes stop_codon:yes gene_type:complete